MYIYIGTLRYEVRTLKDAMDIIFVDTIMNSLKIIECGVCSDSMCVRCMYV